MDIRDARACGGIRLSVHSCTRERSAHTRRSRTRGAKLICARRANVAAPHRHWARTAVDIRDARARPRLRSSVHCSTGVYSNLRDTLRQHERTVARGSAAVPDNAPGSAAVPHEPGGGEPADGRVPRGVGLRAARAARVAVVVGVLRLADGDGEPARGVVCEAARAPGGAALVELVVEQERDEARQPHGQQHAVHHRRVARIVLRAGEGQHVHERVQVPQRVHLRRARGGVERRIVCGLQAVVAGVGHPADDRVQHALARGRVRVALDVAVLVVALVHDGPPQRVPLEREAPAEPECKLQRARRAERRVRKVAVQTHGHCDAYAEHGAERGARRVCRRRAGVPRGTLEHDARHEQRREHVVARG